MAYGTVNVDAMTTSDGYTSAGTYGFKNRIINGAMVIDQRNAGASQSLSNGSGTYTLDRYRVFYDATSAVLTSQQVSTAPTGFNYSQKLTVSTAGTISSGTNCTYMQFIEGYNFADMQWGTVNAKTVTLSFWVYSSVAGTFSVALSDNSSVSYVTTYTISSANTWTQIILTIAGPTSGSWNTTNGVGLNLRWDLGCGSTVTTSSTNAWNSGTYYKATSSTSLITNNGATFYITGVQLEKGSTATSFDYRPYGTELVLCQRYYQLVYPTAGNATTSTIADMIVSCFTPMRANATLGQNGVLTVYDDQVGPYTQSSTSISPLGNANNVVNTIRLGNFSGLTTNRFLIGSPANPSNYVTLSAEL